MEDDLGSLEQFDEEYSDHNSQEDVIMDFQEEKPQGNVKALVGQIGDYLSENYLKELKINKENKQVRAKLRNTNQKVYKEVLDVDKGSLMDVLKKVFEHVKQ